MGFFDGEKIIKGKFRVGDIVEIIETGEIGEVLEVLDIFDTDTDKSYTERMYHVGVEDGSFIDIHEDKLRLIKRQKPQINLF
jgi:hypothetical protein